MKPLRKQIIIINVIKKRNHNKIVKKNQFDYNILTAIIKKNKSFGYFDNENINNK